MEKPSHPFADIGISGRSAGILMHITSLPGPAYIGDIGAAAKNFADFLSRCKQSVWQMLPVQPVSAGQGFSPYSAYSAMATNPLLLSMGWLVEKDWLDGSDIIPGHPTETHVIFDVAKRYKTRLLDKAWLNWKGESPENKNAFETYCKEENDWLHDFALFTVLKEKLDDLPWYEWPAEFRNRNEQALKKFAEENDDEINKVKWVQMIFRDQWHELRQYCTSLNIRLFGDIPIYVAHDSADVWSNRDLFALNEQGSMTEIAGVPPDLFNDNGQLWGMPLFKWDVLQKTGYHWWIKRLKKNFEWFDILRLDHFRGFSAYWSVPAEATSAVSGQWKEGPGNDFFDMIQSSLGKKALVAEDLGEIDNAVYELRDHVHLPGMNVLHFAFSDDMPHSPYLPHNNTVRSLVYTGTHDNNTTVGWYKHLTVQEKKNVSAYAGITLNENNIADQLCRMAYRSSSSLAILPLQDVLSLDESARMNMPASGEGNWTWRLSADLLTASIEDKLKQWVGVFDRGGKGQTADGRPQTAET